MKSRGGHLAVATTPLPPCDIREGRLKDGLFPHLKILLILILHNIERITKVLFFFSDWSYLESFVFQLDDCDSDVHHGLIYARGPGPLCRLMRKPGSMTRDAHVQ